MTKRSIKVPTINHYKDINNTIFLNTEVEKVTPVVEEGGECCPIYKSKKMMSINVEKRSTDEGMTPIFECSECHNKWKI